jgi:5-methylcytosine-specific restriction endonuclease McrA
MFPYKRCVRCGEEKYSELFPSDKRNRDGLSSFCRLCHNKASAKWRLEHPERVKAIQKANYEKHADERRQRSSDYRKSNPEKVAIGLRRWRSKNVEHLRQYDKMTREANPEQRREWLHQWGQTHPEKIREYANNRRAMRTNNGGKITAEEWQELVWAFGSKCLCCGTRENITLDHVVPLVRGGRNDIANAQPLCKSCNSSKGTRNMDYRWGEIGEYQPISQTVAVGSTENRLFTS